MADWSATMMAEPKAQVVVHQAVDIVVSVLFDSCTTWPTHLRLLLDSYIIPTLYTLSSSPDDILAFPRAWALGSNPDYLANSWGDDSGFPFLVGFPRLEYSKNCLKAISFSVTKIDKAITICARAKRRSREVRCTDMSVRAVPRA